MTAAVANAAPEPSSPPPANVTLLVGVPADDDGPWKMIVANDGDVPVRLAADARLLSLEIQPPETPSAAAEPKPGAKANERKPKAPEPAVCKLPSPLRPVGVVDDRALILAPGARYEEIINPNLYCFELRTARALAAGATVTAKLGFPAPPARGAKKPPLDPPFIAEPSTHDAPVSAIKELATAPFTLSRAAVGSDETIRSEVAGPPAGVDERAPRLELSAPGRIDADNELTIGVPFAVKNTGERPATVHIRRDNFLFDIEGPDGPSHCGVPANKRRVPQELFSVLRPGAAQGLEVWVGEMCPDIVFDRPGLYRIWPTLAFPNATDARAVQNWTAPLHARDAILVRVLRGRLPFYAEPPRARGGSS